MSGGGAAVGMEADSGLIMGRSHSMDAGTGTLGNGMGRVLDRAGECRGARRLCCNAASALPGLDDIVVLCGGMRDDVFSSEAGDMRGASSVEACGICLGFRPKLRALGSILPNENPAAGSSWDDTGRVKSLGLVGAY